RLSAVIALTDGMVHDVPQTMPGNAPLHVLIPAKGEETDRRLRVVEAPSYGLVGHSVTVRVAVEDLGLKEAGVAHPPASARLTIRRDGDRAVVEINGVRDRLRVLLVSGEPHQGERTWRRLLKADPSVDLVHFTILRPPEKDDRTPLNELALIAFPVRELFVDKIGEFDLIILDRFQNRGLLPLPYLANIASRVRQG